MTTYAIFFLGEPINGVSEDQLKANLGKLFKCGPEKVERLFSGKPVIVKKNLAAQQAKAYQQALVKAGAKTIIKDEAALAKPSVKKSVPADSTSTPGLSAGLSSLINYNSSSPPAAKEQQIAQANTTRTDAAVSTQNTTGVSSGITLSEPHTGTLEEFAIAVEPVDLPDISQLSMSEPETGSLEEYAPKVIPVELPDISYMDITDMNDRPLSDQSSRPKPVEIPDVSAITMSEPETGSLADYAIKTEPVEVPDTSHLKFID